jgi:hypothetical protein
MGFAEVLTLVLIILKVLELIDWSWWWVFSPLIASLCGALIAAFIIYRIK